VKDLVVGIDVGTTGVKGILLDRNGRILLERNEPCDLLSPKPGYAEENPKIWWKNVLKILKEFSDYGKRISAIGISGMVPTLILIDEDGDPIRNSIQQNDSRTVEEIDYFKRILDEEEFFKKTGNTINQQLIFPKFLWLRKHEPENVRKTRWIMGSYNFINFKLTGVPNIEKNWALESGMWRIQGGWDDEILNLAGIDPSLLPRVYDPWEIIGGLKDNVARETNLPSGIPVVGGSADHIASALGVGMNRDGDLLLKFGGAGDILYITEKLKLSKRLFIDYHDVPGQYVLNGCMASSGSIVKWFKNELSSGMDYDELTRMAEKIAVGSDGLVLLPYFIGEKTPIFDPKARGVLFGLTLYHTKAHLFRSILESTAFGFKHHIEILKDEGFQIKRVFMSNGGAKNELWRKIVSDAIGYSAVYIKNNPGSSFGVAFIAGKSSGLFSDWREIERFTGDSEKVEFSKRNNEIYEKYYKIYRKIYENLRDCFEDLYKLIQEG